MEAKIISLKERLQYIGTRDLLGMIGTHFLTFANDAKGIAEQSDIFSKTKLMSPQKQYTYLAGLLMSTQDKSNGHIIQEDNWEIFGELEDAVQEITFEYIDTFLNIGPEATIEDIKKNLVSMEAFISYFDMGILRYPEQTIKLIRTLYGRFDSELEDILGLTTGDFIAFYELVYDTFEKAMHASAYAVSKLKEFLNSFNPYAVDAEQSHERFLSFVQGEDKEELQNAMDNLNCIKAISVLERFGEEKGRKLLDAFGLYRQEYEFIYYNSKNPFAERPLCWIDEGETLYIVHPYFLINAIYNHITDVLEQPSNGFAERYKKTKADVVENQFLELLKRTFGEQAKYHTSVCEERGTKEHDIVVEFENYILLIEAKASKVREPFFNPEKGYVRVKDHFDSDTGIGGAYKQAIILKQYIEKENCVVLYENKNKKFEIKDVSKKIVLPIVFTLNQFGGIAINTSSLLEKDEEQPYPWVCNLHDFENIIDILNYLKKTSVDFIKYIVWRIQNHSRILSSDELDVIEGYFLDDKIRKANGKGALFFPPNGPSLIDKIYYDNHGIPYDFPIGNTPVTKWPKVGRNDPCPCGSMKKYKKCCLGKE